MNLFGDILDGYGLSGEVWSKMPLDAILAGNRSVGIGFFDDFTMCSDTTLEDGYFRLLTGTGTYAQIASDWDPTSAATMVKTGLGIYQLLGTADQDEAMLMRGNAIDAPYHLGRKDLAFECRFRVETVEADDIGFFIGLAEIGAQATLKCIKADDTLVNEFDFLGFLHLAGESTAVDGMYQVGGQTYADGSTNTGLDTIATLVADTFVKVGFRYDASTDTVHWFFNGVEDTGARLKVSELTAGTFPDDNFMTPFAMLQCPAAADEKVELDWWACAQVI